MPALSSGLGQSHAPSDFQCSSTLRADAPPPEEVPRSYQQERPATGRKRKTEEPLHAPKPPKRPAPSSLTTSSPSTPPKLSLSHRLFQCLDVNPGLYTNDIAQLAITLAFVLRKYHGKVEKPINPEEIDVILVQDKEEGWLPFWPRHGFSLHVVINMKRVAVKGELADSRKGALSGLRNVVEKLAAGP